MAGAGGFNWEVSVLNKGKSGAIKNRNREAKIEKKNLKPDADIEPLFTL